MTPREIRFGIDGLTGVVVVSVAAALASLTWTLAGYANSASPVTAAVDSYVPPAPAPDLSAVINLPPFGRAVVGSTVAGTTTDLVLHGVLLANPAAASTVLISTAGQDPVAYRIGQALPGGRTIDSIAVDHVLLRNGNQLFTLYFPEDERGGNPAAPGAVQGVPAPPPRETPPPPVGMPGGPSFGAPPPPVAAPPATGVDAMRSLLPPSVVPRPPGAQAAPVAPLVASPQNTGRGNGLIDRPPAAVTPQR